MSDPTHRIDPELVIRFAESVQAHSEAVRDMLDGLARGMAALTERVEQLETIHDRMIPGGHDYDAWRGGGHSVKAS